MILNERTTLKELQDAGATTLSDIPLEELLEYVRHACLEVGADLSDSMSPWESEFGLAHVDAASAVQQTIEALRSL